MAHAESVVLKAQVRETGTKGRVRSARTAGWVPGIVYGGGRKPQAVSVVAKELDKELDNKTFYSHVHQLEIDGATEKVLVREVTLHPVKDTPRHIDFMRVTAGTRVVLSLPLIYEDEDQCPGLKRGGVLNTVVTKLLISAEADNIPDSLHVSLKDYVIGQSIHLSDVTVPESARVLKMTPQTTLATILSPSGLTSADSEENAEGEDSSS